MKSIHKNDYIRPFQCSQQPQIVLKYCFTDNMKIFVFLLTFLRFSLSLHSDSPYYYDPVVIVGSDLTEFNEIPIHEIVAYRYDGFEFTPIPSQIDEKHEQNWELIKNNSDCRYTTVQYCKSSPIQKRCNIDSFKT